MTAFEQAWALLKQMSDEEKQAWNNDDPYEGLSFFEKIREASRTEVPISMSKPTVVNRKKKFQTRLPIDNLMTHNTPDRSEIIDGRYKLPLLHQSLAPITPLEERLPKKPIPSHIEFDPNFGTHGISP